MTAPVPHPLLSAKRISALRLLVRFLRLLLVFLSCTTTFQDKENIFLEGLYSPLQEELSEDCEVVGLLPEVVKGEFARNGPNPKFKPKAGYHWFDGDGMVSLIRSSVILFKR